tara:strand:+ start:198 stop:815 length:618 start_codon:yes stop_codon:yes gene_type:complete
MDPYEILGIERNSNLDVIKRAYRRLAKKLHPDLNNGDEAASDNFKEITVAYNILANRKQRALLDQSLNKREAKKNNPSKPWEKGGAWFDFEIDESTGERRVDLFGDVAGTRLGRVKGASATSLWMKGEDIAETLHVTIAEANKGTCKLITTMTGLTVAIDVPKNSSNGDIIILGGFGIEGFGGGPPGDLNVILKLVPNPALKKSD